MEPPACSLSVIWSHGYYGSRPYLRKYGISAGTLSKRAGRPSGTKVNKHSTSGGAVATLAAPLFEN